MGISGIKLLVRKYLVDHYEHEIEKIKAVGKGK